MFSIKILHPKSLRNKLFQNSIQTIRSYLSDRTSQKNKVIHDNSSIEIIGGQHSPLIESNGKQTVAELVIKKTLVINNEDFNDKVKLDKFLMEIKHFCEQAKEIEQVQYLPPHFREVEEESNK